MARRRPRRVRFKRDRVNYFELMVLNFSAHRRLLHEDDEHALCRAFDNMTQQQRAAMAKTVSAMLKEARLW